LQPLFVCCVKTAQFNKIVIHTQRDGSNQIQGIIQVTTGPESCIMRISIAVLAILLLVAAKLESWRWAEQENTASGDDVVCTAWYSCFALGTSGFDTRSKGQRPW